ncbi:cysteinyl-tRNA synthetase [Desulfosalsimonas propionicica]|uniref:Cysteine--tRNA ligase n=1 Tax=Desulfosalsimonas propionicica TaxID=332175 RepID=A0A7W0C7U4_9BACT|nr:cysteine--tRNA ligase [Desulfosalsimonas propionicica]MBA2880748.1 cysteinyl-tRNA synthetase [Desulfosalsimonas propionicica]
MHYSILDTIGNTPMVEIRRLNPNPAVRILAKLEYVNPGGSIKDRPALAMIEAGEQSGELTSEKTVIEATSGNTGIGLAMICAVKGYRVMLAMSDAVSLERRKILEARGAEIFLTPGHLGTDGAIEEVYRLVREDPDRYFMTDQYNNPANWQAHYQGTAGEIIEQTGGKISAFVATMGTTGTVMGCARRFREYDPDIRIIGVEPYLGHKLQGLKNLKEAYRPEIFEKKWLDEKINIDDEEAFEMTRRLAREEGLFVGMSSGAAMVIAARQAAEMTEGTIVAIFADSGERYLSTPLFLVKKKAEIHLFNTLTRSKMPFDPIQKGRVSMYTCGPTANKFIHLGECRRFVFSDLLYRYLRYRDLDVNHVMNITDMDDKTIQGSESAGQSLVEYTRYYIDRFMADLEALNIVPADHFPRASEHVDDMVRVATGLYDKGFAYEKLRSLYFSIGSFSEYGQLSGIDIDKIKLGATVDLDEYEKNNPRDFTLLKRARLSELKRGIYVKTQWGNVRPSWHIQCAAISMKHLGKTYDIHTSTRELVFPHHENERAIAKALTGKPLARYWVHCEQVHAGQNGTRAQKQGLPTLEDLRNMGYTPRDVRFWLITGHYRKPLEYGPKRLDQAQNAIRRIDACIKGLQQVDQAGNDAASTEEIDQIAYDIRQGLINAMDDDLNMPRAMAAIFRKIRRINALVSEKRLTREQADKFLNTFEDIDQVLGFFDFTPKTLPPEIEALIRERNQARARKDFARADEIRQQLQQAGVEIKDEKIGDS